MSFFKALFTFWISISVLLVVYFFCSEKVAKKYPNCRYSKWWREAIVKELDPDDRNF